MVVVLWQNWGEHVGRQLPHFLAGATLTDVTITVGPRSIKAHRIILAFFSPFFKKMLEEVSEERPMVVVFPGVNFDALQVIVAYMYRGQVNVPAELLPHVIELAKMLKVKGLIELPAQLDTVIAGSGGKVSTEHDSANQDHLDIHHEDEGLVEFEVTAAEHEPSVTSNSQQPVNSQHPITVMTQNTTEVQPVSTIQIQHTEHSDRQKISTTVPNRMEIAKGEEEDEHVLIQPEDIQLSTVDDLTHTQIVKLSENGAMGEVLFSGDYMQSERSEEHQGSADDSICLQEGQDYAGAKKRRKIIYKLARYGPEDLQRAIEDVRSGMGTLREIAERWGVPHSTLSVNARMAGISVQQRNLDYDNETLEAAKQAVKGGSSYMKVAREYNIPKSVLWRWCQREGMLRGEAKRCCNYSPEDLEQARQMLIDGRSLSNIVKDTKIPKTTLFRIKEQLVREGKMPASCINRTIRPRRPSENSLQQAIAACKEEGMSQGRASEKYQVSKTTVWRRLKRLKQQDPDQSNVEDGEIDRQNVKIEVVDNLPGDHLGDTYNEEITMRYTEDGDLRYVGAIGGQNPGERTLDCSVVDTKYANLSGTEKLLQSKVADGQTKMTSDKHVAYEVVPESAIVQSESQNIVIASSQSSFIDSKHLGIFTSEGHMIQAGDQLTIAQDNKVNETDGTRESAANTRFELEMPLMNLPGGGYQVVGSEIVIGGQQICVIEPSGSNPHHTSNSDHHLVVASFSQMEGLDDLSKVDRTVSVENLEAGNQQVQDLKQESTRSQQNSN